MKLILSEGGGRVVSAENIRGTEIQWRELHHRRSVSLPVVQQRACEISKKESIFTKLDRHRLDSALFERDAFNITDRYKFLLVGRIIYRALARRSFMPRISPIYFTGSSLNI